jgi:hypothetical protein
MLIGFVFSCEFFIYEGPQVFPLMVLAAINAPVIWFCSWCFARVPPNITGRNGKYGYYVYISFTVLGFLFSESITTICYMGYNVGLNLYEYSQGDATELTDAFEHFIAMVGAAMYSYLAWHLFDAMNLSYVRRKHKIDKAKHEERRKRAQEMWGDLGIADDDHQETVPLVDQETARLNKEN